ncbi:HIPL1 protein-like [Impatiens glandulifera]|uniref:HIPL1 protein-like n=1 Tax=Impatiens glandulifera TaxID=253017 RepID=UPI001FB07731|nr:HIPL1 protein-like [Impatiens glandulifera]
MASTCHFAVLSSFLFFLLVSPSFSLPLCTDSTAPFTPNVSLTFCPYNGTNCCDGADDLLLKNQFESMNISDPACASLLKSSICSKCDPFSAELFRVKSNPRMVPVLCNSTVGNSDFCTQIWNTCQNVSIMNSPFAAIIKGQGGQPSGSNFTKLTDFWQSKTDFCSVYGGENEEGGVCFNGGPVVLTNKTEASSIPVSGLCLEKIGNGSYLDMAAHPDGSGRAFFSNQQGRIWLATIPKQGSGGTLTLDESSPFLDLTDEVHFDTQFGMMGIAFHPNFTKNGRFFASFNCDKSDWPGCGGRCSCNSDVNCDPTKLPSDSGALPCQYQTVIAEFAVDGSSADQPAKATKASPSEVRRIFTMGLPFTSHHGGQILFGPADGYLYLMMGDGGGPSGTSDPYNFSQNKKSLLGKIIRLDVDNIPSGAEISKLGLWGNYSIPSDNPYKEDNDLQPEIWALGMRNPWRCSFDSERPSYFMCADVGQDTYEEVDIITKGGNYGWRVYEGPSLYNAPSSPGGNTSAASIKPIFPVMGYRHSDVSSKVGSASITGGFFYRSTTDPCMTGRYLYTDLYAGAMWAGVETPENSGNFNTSKITFSCAPNSPIACDSRPGNSLPSLGYIFSFGQDNDKDIYLLTSSGVYRVVPPSRCNYTCAKENVTNTGSPGPTTSSPKSQAFGLRRLSIKNLAILCCGLVLFLMGIL